MKNRKYQVRSNFNKVTPEQQDKVYQNVTDSVNWLYKAVRERKIREFLEEVNKGRLISNDGK